MPQLTLTKMSSLARTPPSVGLTNIVKRTPPSGINTSTMTNDSTSAASSKTSVKTNKRSRTEDETENDRTDADMNDQVDAPLTLESAVAKLMNQFSQTNLMIANLRSDINMEIAAVKTVLEEKLANVSQEINSLRNESTLKFQTTDVVLDSLHDKVECISHSVGNLGNRSDLIISGIPFMNGENLNVFFEAICRQIGYSENYVPMADVRRINNRPLKDGDESLVIVEFGLRNARDDFYGCYLQKRNLTLRDLGLESDKRVYINENLTSLARKIKAAALRLKKAGKLTAVHTKLGVVHVRQSTGTPFVVIRTEDELNQFL